MASVQRAIANGASVGEAVTSAVTIPGGLVSHLQAQQDNGDDDAVHASERALADLRTLCTAAITFAKSNANARLASFLEITCGLEDVVAGAGQAARVTLSTIHRGKGLEASMVALLGCEESVLPHWRSADVTLDEQSGGLEEERRLFYVALTRACDELLITSVRLRDARPTSGPSRFLAEAGL